MREREGEGQRDRETLRETERGRERENDRETEIYLVFLQWLDEWFFIHESSLSCWRTNHTGSSLSCTTTVNPVKKNSLSAQAT